MSEEKYLCPKCGRVISPRFPLHVCIEKGLLKDLQQQVAEIEQRVNELTEDAEDLSVELVEDRAYNWICPICNALHRTAEVANVVECEVCGREYSTRVASERDYWGGRA